MKCSHGTIITSMAVVLLLEVIGIDMDMAGRGRIREEGGKSPVPRWRRRSVGAGNQTHANIPKMDGFSQACKATGVTPPIHRRKDMRQS